MQIVEIDPTKKYLLVFELRLSRDEVERIKGMFAQFVEDPEMHFAVIEGVRLVKLADGYVGGGEVVLGADKG